jgi:hypothetical protein
MTRNAWWDATIDPKPPKREKKGCNRDDHLLVLRVRKEVRLPELGMVIIGPVLYKPVGN